MAQRAGRGLAWALLLTMASLPMVLPLVTGSGTWRPSMGGDPPRPPPSSKGPGIWLGQGLELAGGQPCAGERVCVAAAAKKKAEAEGPLRRAVTAMRELRVKAREGARALGEKIYGTRHHLLAGAIARCVAVTIMFPVDTIKTRLQVHGADCCTPMQMKEAMRFPIYPGVSSSLLGQVPNAMLVYGSYELYKRELSTAFPKLNVTQVRFAAAMLGDITGSVWLSPWEGTKQRVQAGVYKGVPEAFKGIIQQEGFGGLYRGYSAQVFRDLAFHAIQLPLYEGVKEVWLKSRRKDAAQRSDKISARRKSELSQARLDPWESMVCGAVAGATSGALTCPLDVIKTRLMAQKFNPSLPSSISGVFIEILSREGLLGFTAGLRERAIYIALGSALFWTVFEQSKAFLEEVDRKDLLKSILKPPPGRRAHDRPSPARLVKGFVPLLSAPAPHKVAVPPIP